MREIISPGVPAEVGQIRIGFVGGFRVGKHAWRGRHDGEMGKTRRRPQGYEAEAQVGIPGGSVAACVTGNVVAQTRSVVIDSACFVVWRRNG
ncbi:MAG: hypothetical protein WAO35_12730 [Terriglobia bacterium]